MRAESNTVGNTATGYTLPINRFEPARWQRLQSRQSNVQTVHESALAISFPVMRALLGPEFFCVTASVYWQWTSFYADRQQQYGAEFPAFLAKYLPSADLPYLSDVAKLEWLRQEALAAPKPESPGPDALDIADTATQKRPVVAVHPSVRLCESAYPVLSIWKYCQAGELARDTLSCDTPGERVCINRARDGRLRMQLLSPGAYSFICALQSGQDVWDAAVTTSRFDAVMTLARWIRHGIVVAPPAR
ncbi:MAG TPA: putative DNA-binding domain-containing protein [Woeseiaceae bacterium]|nr:putative DNA-binding domain-containing protein [Woeseiaceae bacterium]